MRNTMSFLALENVAVSGITACVPKRIIDNLTQDCLRFAPTPEERRKFVDSTGIRRLRFAEPEVCGSDLACQAGEDLLTALKVDRGSIDQLIFLTQTPDYLGIPPTACILQHRLGLATRCSAYDLTHNCGGFVVALQAAMCAAAAGMRVLLLVGETLSRTGSMAERQGGLMFGDAAAALLIERREGAGKVFFSLGNDGKDFDAIIIEAGGYRRMASAETLRERIDADGELRTSHQGRMDKMRVFDFAMGTVAPSMRAMLEYAGLAAEEMEKFYVHQANLQIVEYLRRKMRADSVRMPLSLDEFGNTSTVSVPLGIAADLGDGRKHSPGKVMFTAFGGGLAWGNCILELRDCYIGAATEYRL